VTDHPLHKYLRPGSLPHFFCAGCGVAQVLNYFLHAVDNLGLDMDRLVAVGGVGCTARIPVYLNADALHGIHGRTLPWATGIKLHNPELKVVIFAGDGDAAAIGGNHLVHAARRNVDVTMIVVNNLTYGMTGGQAAPTTQVGLRTTTTPYGNLERPLDICRLAVAAGATFVARSSTSRSRQAISMIRKALEHEGFALVEIVAQCPTGFGRRAIGSEDSVRGVEWIGEHSITSKEAAGLSQHDLEQRFSLGKFADIRLPIFKGDSLMPPRVCDS
jgi:2-oxoglutarate ferredoxin oxidoreductase subunit beta